MYCSSVSGAVTSSSQNPTCVVSYAGGTHAAATVSCESRVSAVGLAASTALLSIYQASLGEPLVCLRFSPWALRTAPPKPCCATTAFAHGATKRAVHARLLCTTLPGIFLCQIWHAQTRCAHASGPDVARSAALTVLHWMPPVPRACGAFLLSAWLKGLLAAKDSTSCRLVLTRPREYDLPCRPVQQPCSFRGAHRELQGRRGTRLESSRLSIALPQFAARCCTRRPFKARAPVHHSQAVAAAVKWGTSSRAACEERESFAAISALGNA